MKDPFRLLKISKNASNDEIFSAHLKALRGKSDPEKREINLAKELLKDELDQEKVKIHCFNFPSDDILFDCIKKTINPWD